MLLRHRLLIAAAAPLAPATAALAGADATATAGVGAVAAVAAAAGVAVSSKSLAWLAQAAPAAGRAEAWERPEKLPPEVAAAAEALASLQGRLLETEQALARTQAQLQSETAAHNAAFAAIEAAARQLGDPAQTPPKLTLAAAPSTAAAAGKAGAAFKELGDRLLLTRHRLTATLRVLQACPWPLVSADGAGAVRYLNPAAERLFGKKLADAQRGTLDDLIASPEEPDPLGREPLPASGAASWAASGAGAAAAVAGGRRVLAQAARGGPGDPASYLVLRELGDDDRLLAADRARTREEALTSAWAFADRAVGDHGAAGQNFCRLLIGDAKSLPQRDQLLPRLKAVLQLSDELELHSRFVRWLSAALAGALPPPRPVEVEAGRAVADALDVLRPLLASRNVQLQVDDEGGWVVADEDWLALMAQGLASHAAATLRDAPLAVRLRRSLADDGEREGYWLMELPDAGPPLTPEQWQALDSPLGGLESPALLPVADGDGYLPGLFVARRLAEACGGHLDCQTTPSGRLAVRLALPAFVGAEGSAAPAGTPAADGGPADELCMGWTLGAAS